MRSNVRYFIVVTIVALLLGILAVAGCKEGQKSTNGNNRNIAETRAKANFRTFVTYRYIDPMTGIEAFRLLIPKGWLAEGKIAWSSNPALPAQARFRFYNPNGTEELNFFPTQSHFFSRTWFLFRPTKENAFILFGNSFVCKQLLVFSLTSFCFSCQTKKVPACTCGYFCVLNQSGEVRI